MRLYARAAQAEVDKGKEYILRDAPALVVAIGSKKDIHRTHDSGHSCLSYAELYAPTLGLGNLLGSSLNMQAKQNTNHCWSF